MNTFIAIQKGTTRDDFLSKDNIALLKSFGKIYDVDGELCEDGIKAAIGDAEVYMSCWGSPRLTENIISSAPNLKLLVHLCGTVAPFVSDAQWERGIRVISGNAFFARSTAEGTLAYILSAQRDIPFYAKELKESRHRKTAESKSRALIGKTVGILSYGAVARELVKLLQPFGVKILVYDIVPIQEEEKARLGMVQVGLEELFSSADIISVHTPLNSGTHHLIGSKLLEKIRPDALLVNASRGAVIDQGALEDELEKGHFRALLDVYDPEPPLPDCRLFSLPNVIMMPHMAGPTTDIYPDIAEALIKEAHGYIDCNMPLCNEISRKTAERMSER